MSKSTKLIDKLKTLAFKHMLPTPTKQQKIKVSREKIDYYLLLHSRQIRSLQQKQGQNDMKSFAELSNISSDILLNDKKIYNMNILDLRNELQNSLYSDIINIFHSMHYVDSTLLLHVNDNVNVQQQKQEERNNNNIMHDISTIKSILLKEYHQLNNMAIPSTSIQNNDNKELPFLSRKYGALQTLLSSSIFHNSKPWLVLPTTTSSNNNNNNMTMQEYYLNHFNQEENDGKIIKGLDDFGHDIRIINDDDNKKRILYYNHLIHFARATLLKQEIGYSTIPLRSTISSTKYGLYLNGKASMGSIISFFPGEVYTSEHLSDMDVISKLKLDVDDNYQLSTRYDNILIDSRSSPYIINTLDEDNNKMNNNMLSFAHVVNHPSNNNNNSTTTATKLNNQQVTKPNCSLAMINYTNSMITKTQQNTKHKSYKQYIPNEYGCIPKLLSIHSVLDYNKDICMYGLCLIANRDIENEELFFDYRLGNDDDDLPDWYVPIHDDRYDSIYDDIDE